MSDFPDLFDFEQSDYPDTPGHRGVDTSIAAAADIALKLGRLQLLAEEAIRAAGYHGLTADELAARLSLDRWSIQPRTTELKRKGLVVDSGMRRANCTGKSAIVWCAPVSGCAVRLAPVAREMIIAEGIEDALTLQQELGIPAWAAAGAGMLQRVLIPEGATSIIIGADRDDAGEAAAQAVAQRLAAEGRTVRIIRPLPGYKDWNAELQGTRS